MKHFAFQGLWLLCCWPTLGGCAAIWGSVHLLEANKAVSLAQEAQTAPLMSYEYTMAQQYLQESWERYNRSDYQASVELANLAAEWAEKASQQTAENSDEQEER